MYKLTRKAYQLSRNDGFSRITKFTLNGKEAYSYAGYHAEYDLPPYKFIGEYIDRVGVREAGEITIDLNTPEVVRADDFEQNGEMVARFINGATANIDYINYMQARYPGCKFLNADRYQPIAIVKDGELMAVVMPLRG